MLNRRLMLCALVVAVGVGGACESGSAHPDLEAEAVLGPAVTRLCLDRLERTSAGTFCCPTYKELLRYAGVAQPTRAHCEVVCAEGRSAFLRCRGL